MDTIQLGVKSWHTNRLVRRLECCCRCVSHIESECCLISYWMAAHFSTYNIDYRCSRHFSLCLTQAPADCGGWSWSYLSCQRKQLQFWVTRSVSFEGTLLCPLHWNKKREATDRCLWHILVKKGKIVFIMMLWLGWLARRSDGIGFAMGWEL